MFLVSGYFGIGFGWAKPVPVNPLRFRHPRRDDILVSLAGVTVNLAQCVVWSLLAWAVVRWMPYASWSEAAAAFCALGAAVNLMLAYFNLLPIPPLDGSHVAAQLLPLRDPFLMQRLAPVGFILLFLFIQSPYYNRLMDIVYFPVLERLVPIEALAALQRLF